MKRFTLLFGLFALALGAASCDITFSKKNEVPPADSNSIVLNTDKDWTKSDLTAFIGDLSALPQELQTEEMDRILREGSEVSPDSVLNKGKPHCYAAFTHMVGMTCSCKDCGTVRISAE